MITCFWKLNIHLLYASRMLLSRRYIINGRQEQYRRWPDNRAQSGARIFGKIPISLVKFALYRPRSNENRMRTIEALESANYKFVKCRMSSIFGNLVCSGLSGLVRFIAWQVAFCQLFYLSIHKVYCLFNRGGGFILSYVIRSLGIFITC